MSRSHKTRTVFLRSHDRPKPERRPEPCPVIAELWPDGFVQIFGPKHIRVAVLNHFEDEGGQDLENLIEEFHTEELPRTHRPFYEPRHILAMANVERRTIESHANTEWELAVVRSLKKAGDVLRKGRRPT